MRKVVCFDFDGVIINSTNVQRYALEKSYYKVFGKALDEKVFQQFLLHSGDSLTNIFTKLGLPLEMVSFYREYSIEKDEEVQIYKGVTELLEYLNSNNILCGLCTGKDRERTIGILKKKNILAYFEKIICSDDVTMPKPHPESLLTIMKHLDVNKGDAIMVGDAVNDILCAKNAGVFSVAVTWGTNKEDILLDANPNIVVENIQELKQAINRFFHLEKRKMLFNDFVVAEDKCNLQCEYCLTQTDQIKNTAKIVRKISECSYYEGTEFKWRLDKIQEKILEQLDIAILKISGGEILLLPEIQTYILSQAKRYKGVQVLTNGVLLNESVLKDYKNAGNINLQISLDSNNFNGNSYRTKNQRILKRILNNIDMAYKIGVQVEINCVLTDRSISYFREYLDYLKKYQGGIRIYPFPVRGVNKNFYHISKSKISEIDGIIERYDEYADILAPKAYMTYLADFLKNGERNIPCYLPHMAIGVFENGDITPCPNYWFMMFGNVLEDNKKTLQKVGNDKIYKILTGERITFSECKSCFTPWDSFNLYIEGILSYQDLIKSPTYSFKGIREYIDTISERIKHD